MFLNFLWLLYGGAASFFHTKLTAEFAHVLVVVGMRVFALPLVSQFFVFM